MIQSLGICWVLPYDPIHDLLWTYSLYIWKNVYSAASGCSFICLSLDQFSSLCCSYLFHPSQFFCLLFFHFLRLLKSPEPSNIRLGDLNHPVSFHFSGFSGIWDTRLHSWLPQLWLWWATILQADVFSPKSLGSLLEGHAGCHKAETQISAPAVKQLRVIDQAACKLGFPELIFIGRKPRY